jgi:NAD(P)H dehydrogenase (quinone)
MSRIAVIYYSATGTVHKLAQALAEGAADEGAEVRLRRVAELAPREAIESNPQWREHLDTVASQVPEATLADLEWADGMAFGTPTRYGAPAAQLKQFLDSTGPLWSEGKLADKPVTAFTSASQLHGGQEATILPLSNVFYHWGTIMVPPGYTDDVIFAAGGNPYGTSVTASEEGPAKEAIEAARYQGRRLARFTALVRNAAGRAAV